MRKQATMVCHTSITTNMKKLLLSFLAIGLLSINFASAQVQTNYWKLISNVLQPVNSSWTVSTGGGGSSSAFITTSSSTATSTFAGNVQINGDLRILGNFYAPVSIISAGNINPSVDNTYHLGTTALRWMEGRFGTGTSTFAGRVGIGTTTPGSALQVVGDIQSDSFTTLGNYNGGPVSVVRAGQGSISNNSFAFNNDVNTGIYSPSANVIGFTTDGAERVRIDAVGNVGIGTTTPVAKLNVSSTTEQLRLNYDASNYASFTVGSGGILNISGSATLLQINSSWLFNGANYFSTGGAQIQSSSSGTANPLKLSGGPATLNYIGTASLFSSIQNIGGMASASGASTYVNTTVAPTINTSGSYAGDVTSLQVSPFLQSVTGVAKNLLVDFGTNSAAAGAGTHTSRFVVTSAGNVGIGTSTPTSLLSVASSTATGVERLVNFGTTTEIMTVLANGNIGIASSTPNHKLSVAGTGFFSGIVTFLSNLLISAEVRYDGLPDSDHSAVGGTTATFNASTTVTVMDLVVMNSTGGFILTDADCRESAHRVTRPRDVPAESVTLSPLATSRSTLRTRH